MRELNGYSLKEWGTLTPLKYWWKEVRNDVMLRRYLTREAPEEGAFLEACRGLAGKDVIASIAFECPLAIEWMLSLARRDPGDVRILIFDNSRSPERRAEIRQICQRLDTPYLSLPPNRTRHANRSHGLALSWVFHRILARIQPRYFGFVDHDMIPIAPIRISETLRDQPCYGTLNLGTAGWNLWAGFCFFDFSKVAGKPLNFLYDFSRELDTGGRNWEHLYRQLDRSRLQFASLEYVNLKEPECGEVQRPQVIDQQWIHIGSIGYGDHFARKRAFYSRVVAHLAAGGDPGALLAEGNRKAIVAEPGGT